jgi:adenylate cyclase
MKKYKQLPVISAMTSFFIITILGIHYFFPVLENASYDLSLSLIKKRPPDSIVIIGLDPRSVSEFGTLPWPRILTADLIRKIQSCNPRVIAMDFLFPKRPDDPGTDSLVALFSTIPHLVTGMRVDNVMEGQETSIALVTPEAYKHRFLMLKQPEKLPQSVGYAAGKLDFGDPYLSQYATRAGFLNVATSRTSQKLREIIHVIRAGKEYYPSFGLAAAAEFCGVKPDKLILDGNGRILLNDKKILFTRGTGSVYINYRGKPGTFPTVSAADVLAGTVDPALLKNKLVFVGITDALSSPTDFFLTPEGPQFPGVEIWATATADILENSWIRRGGLVPALNLIILFCIFPGVIALFPLKKKKYAIAAGTGIVALSLVGSIVILQTTGHYWNAGVHFYAWAFMILWYATRKTDLIVVRENRCFWSLCLRRRNFIRPPGRISSGIFPKPILRGL